MAAPCKRPTFAESSVVVVDFGNDVISNDFDFFVVNFQLIFH
jgi:hypothetical protein